MKCIVLEDYNTNLSRVLRSLQIQEKKVRQLKDDEVLIKMEATPCNPSDIAFVRGMYNIKKKIPVIPGFEGTGTVVHTGSVRAAQNLIGKRVSCFTQENADGTWAEYFITSFSNCIEINEDIPVDQAACLAINPFTAYALVEIARNKESETLIQNAAAGQIGGFVRQLAKQHNIQVINIVRKDEHVELLRKTGEQFVLNQTSETFADDLQKMAFDNLATIAFDAVGGDMTGEILNAMPDNSTVVLYGGLSGQPSGNMDVLDIIFHQKSLVGFNLGDWIKEIKAGEFEEISAKIQKLVLDGYIHTQIQATYPIDNIVRALLQYVGNMSKGKILFQL